MAKDFDESTKNLSGYLSGLQHFCVVTNGRRGKTFFSGDRNTVVESIALGVANMVELMKDDAIIVDIATAACDILKKRRMKIREVAE